MTVWSAPASTAFIQSDPLDFLNTSMRTSFHPKPTSASTPTAFASGRPAVRLRRVRGRPLPYVAPFHVPLLGGPKRLRDGVHARASAVPGEHITPDFTDPPTPSGPTPLDRRSLHRWDGRVKAFPFSPSIPELYSRWRAHADLQRLVLQTLHLVPSHGGVARFVVYRGEVVSRRIGVRVKRPMRRLADAPVVMTTVTAKSYP